MTKNVLSHSTLIILGIFFIYNIPLAHATTDWNTGSFTKNMADASWTTTTITHGLGYTPKYIEFKGYYINGNNTYYSSGIWTANGQTSDTLSLLEGGSTGINDLYYNNNNLTATTSIGIVIGSTNYYGWVYSVNSTTITIKWIRFGSPTGTWNITWTAAADEPDNTGCTTFSCLTGLPTTLSGYGITDGTPTSRTLSINSTTYDLTANRSWTISGSGSTTPLSTTTPDCYILGSDETGNITCMATTTLATQFVMSQMGYQALILFLITLILGIWTWRSFMP